MASAKDEPLSKRLLQVAKKELHENPDHIAAHLESFERWVKSLPHIEFPHEHRLLLPFLRHAKYTHAKAQKRLDNFCTLRASEQLGIPDWFKYPLVSDPSVEEYLKSGIVVELGKTKEDVTVLLSRISGWNMDQLDRQSMRRIMYMDIDRLMIDPIVQIVGYAFFMDLEGVSMKHLTMRTSRKEMKMETKVWQEAYPFRFKHLIYYKEPGFLDAMFKLTEVWLSKKIRERILRVKNNLKKAYDKVPGLKEIMPAEYGGGNAPLSVLMERHAVKFREFYSKPSPWCDIKVDESKRPETAKNLMREYKELDLDLFGTEGTFIKLDEDA